MPIVLPSRRTAAHLIREAVAARTLQCQGAAFDPKSARCEYSGPCVIGVLLSPEERARLDALPNVPIAEYIHRSTVTAPPEVDLQVWSDLQMAHDTANIPRILAIIADW